MCRLFALAASRPVDLVFSLGAAPVSLRRQSEDNPDGWGLGWYEEGRPVLRKEPLCAASSPSFREAGAARSRLFVAHVRHATTGCRAARNCHPFASGKWLFAHNGMLNRSALLSSLSPERRDRLEGETDSEVLFHWLLQRTEEHPGGVAAAAAEAARAAEDWTALNFVLSDGENIYAYRQARSRTDYYSLFYLVRRPALAGPDQYLSADTSALLRCKALSNERAVLVASERMTAEHWRELPVGALLRVGPDLKMEVGWVGVNELCEEGGD